MEETVTHLPDCVVGKARKCPSPNSLHGEAVGEHWWSGWPGAYCMKCGDWDAQETCFGHECVCACHEGIFDGPDPSEVQERDDSE